MEWISVETALPQSDGFYICYAPSRIFLDTTVAMFSGSVFHTGDEVTTHWMPLPKPPQESE